MENVFSKMFFSSGRKTALDDVVTARAVFKVTVRLALSRPPRFKILKSEENIDLSNVCWTP